MQSTKNEKEQWSQAAHAATLSFRNQKQPPQVGGCGLV